ncbi:leucine--tRNA ligase [Corynebacterium mendelii]|uniref:Leucine--tRNA ligase n=1 Tax=Corynebacterium mendelii TaxID=2765362 RepID=A0A939E0G1_9CORY|nr:leucine--tRNA ligase [Corynebacterium mendelii]MBN9644398.1 leucine--tRNA ligase [Corynebacterium mendelii]
MTRPSEVPAHRYSPELAGKIEKTWQSYWRDNGTFQAPNPVGDLAPADGVQVPDNKLFVQDMFPFPSGVGLHVGHPLGYIATDVFGRFHRMLGTNVLHTMGYDAFGLPAEQYAIQTGTHPAVKTKESIANMERQLDLLGLAHDKRRSFATTDPDYYRWTQWIFLTIFNSWFDPEENKARHIDELIPLLESGARPVPAELADQFGTTDYASLDRIQKAEVIDRYRLVYRSSSMVNWCPGLGTVLANEEVTAEGKSERGDFPVFRKKLSQWMMRITAYADRLVDDLEYLDWPDKVKAMQRNWIGRSVGAEVDFTCQGHKLTVFTTRPDTLFGATYMVLAPEHELVDDLVAGGTGSYDGIDSRWTFGEASPAAAVAAYRTAIAAKSELERQENKDKTGVFTGAYATNPVNGEKIPVFIADYVLTGYGTGAIMAVPAHDDRDWEFATVFGLPIVEVVAGGNTSQAAYTESGKAVNSANDSGLDINGLAKVDAIAQTIAWLEDKGVGTKKIQYKLRDWLFARQRYWGEPFPIVYDSDGLPHALPESMLPVTLPEVDDYKPVSFDPEDKNSEPHPPLAKAKDWLTVELDLGDGPKTYTRDTNVMPQWAGSSWYQLRYIDPNNDRAFCDKDNEAYWTGPRPDIHGPNDPGGVDFYVGGVEHAVLHLLYSRFWHKILFDLGYVTSKEPYRRLYNQGYIQAYAYRDSRGMCVPAAEVEEKDGKFFYDGQKVTQEYGKMGKSLKNAIAPDDFCAEYGADTLRVYEMSMGPLDQSKPWATKDVIGAQRFLQRLWRLVVDETTGRCVVTADKLTDGDAAKLHRTIAGARDDYENLRLNTVVAKLIEYVNYLTKTYPAGAPVDAVAPAVLMLAPVAPHICEELWQRLGHDTSLAYEPFPDYDDKWLVDDTVTYPVQVNGKVRATMEVPVDADKDSIVDMALAQDNVRAHVDGKEIRKTIVVPGKIVNIVVG